MEDALHDNMRNKSCPHSCSIWYDTFDPMLRRPSVPPCNWWHLRLLCSRRITGVKYLRAMEPVQSRKVQWRGPLSAPGGGIWWLWSPVPQTYPHKGPCRCLHHSFALLRKRLRASWDCSGIWELLCFSAPSTSKMDVQVSPAIWSSQPAVFGQHQVLWFR